jgi:ABC-type polysaccharide/polyol phosphate export permease
MFNRIKEIFAYRSLLYRLVLKEFKVRYKHPFLGIVWALVIPLCMILIFIVVFSYFLKVPHQGYPFFIFLASAVFPWNFLNLSITTSTMSFLDNSELVKKVYFPREIIPISIVTVNLILFVLTIFLMLIFVFFSGLKINSGILFLPLVVFMQTAFICGICLIVSSLQAKYRDIKYIVEALLIFWFYLSPVFYSLNTVASISDNVLAVYMLNPLTQLITFYRIALINGYWKTLPAQLDLPSLIFTNCAVCLATLLLGLAVFKKYDQQLADLI